MYAYPTDGDRRPLTGLALTRGRAADFMTGARDTEQQPLDGSSPAESDRDSREWYVDFESQD
jgi:hypothetical protein